MSDICGMLAPKPQCIITAVHDWLFPIEGVRQVYREIERIYHLVNAPERLRLIEVDAPHGYDRTMREAAYGWLAYWLKGDGDGSPIAEIDLELLPPAYPRPRPDAETSPGLCFPHGRGPLPGPAITALTTQLAAVLPPARQRPASADDWASQRRDLLGQVQAVLGPWPTQTTKTRNPVYNRTLFDRLIGERLVFESEPGIELPAIFLAPAQWRSRTPVVLYVDEWGKSAGLANGMIEQLLAAQIAVLAVDVRGAGEAAASDFEATSNALMTDRPFFAQQLWDVLQALDCLWRGNNVTGRIDKSRIGCLGAGLGGLLALYAAALDERLAATVAWQAPLSYKSLIVEQPAFPARAYLFDVLNHFDLPDLMAAVAPRPLLIAAPVDGLRQPLPPATIPDFCDWPDQLYSLLGAAAGTWQVWAETPEQPTIPDRILEWLRVHL
jgi:dienelactone hydrolase